MKESKNSNNNNRHSAEGNDNGSKLRDTRNRSVKQLLEELKIKSEMQANFLRWNEKISYNEWQRLHDWFNNQEIVQMARK
jgi:coenzyme F420-reducing hydrogenase delta subunit